MTSIVVPSLRGTSASRLLLVAKRWISARGALMGVFALAIAGCGGDSPYSPVLAGPSATVSITQLDPLVAVGRQLQFSATVTVASNPAVTWSVSPSGPGAPTISNTGLLTAGAAEGVYTVIADSVAYPQVYASTTVTVTAPVVASRR